MDAAVEKAAKAAGGIAALARQLGVTRAAIHQWNHVPATRVLAVERLTGVPRHEQRPDIYPPPKPSPPMSPTEPDGEVESPDRERTPS